LGEDGRRLANHINLNSHLVVKTKSIQVSPIEGEASFRGELNAVVFEECYWKTPFSTDLEEISGRKGRRIVNHINLNLHLVVKTKPIRVSPIEEKATFG